MSFHKPLIPHINTVIDAKYVVDLCKLDTSDSYLNSTIQDYMMSYRKTKDPLYRDKILLCYGKVVLTTAKKYQNNNVNLADLLSEGFIAVINAINNYDPTKGIKFITYATWIIERHLRDVLDTYNLPVYVPKYIRNNIKIIYKYTCEAEIQGKSVEEIIGLHVEDGTITKKRKVELESFLDGITTYRAVSFEKTNIFNEDLLTASLESTNEDPTTEVVDESTSFSSTDFNLDLIRLLEILEEKERLVLVQNLGLFNTTQKSFNELSIILNITTERVRQLKERAINKIKKSPGSLLLAKYL